MAYQKHTTRDVYAEVTATIIQQIEAGLDGKWKRPWRTIAADGSSYFPASADGRSYRGINTLILLSRAQSCGYARNVWGTYRAWQGHDAQVRKGERGTLVTLWRFTKVKDRDSGEEKTIPFVRGFCVFNASQVDGWEAPEAPTDTIEERHTAAHDALRAYLDRERIGLHAGGDHASYSPMLDAISIPVRHAFRTEEDYLATLAHEQGHSTGCDKRLDRQFGGRFGDDAYAVEELVAELSSAMTMAALGVELPEAIDDAHARYVAHWLDILKADKRAIFTAASKAQAASDLILDRVQEQTEQLPKAA